MKKALITAACAFLIFTAFLGCSKSTDSKLDFTGSNYTIPELDLSTKPDDIGNKYNYLYELTTVDDSKSYIAHPDSVLLKNGNILTVYPLGHGKGAIQTKISSNGGKTWDSSLKNTPKSWKNSQETPTIYRLNFTDGKTDDKLIIISANPKWGDKETDGGFNCSFSEDEGQNWTEFETFY
ncbi:MAG: hypothetical protein LUG21_04305, partial [Clostridiales bacterium]|nr:hypothetical protein [Clostridiales bacterium]